MESGRNWINRGATRWVSQLSLSLSLATIHKYFIGGRKLDVPELSRRYYYSFISDPHGCRKYIGSIIITTMSENCDENVGLVAHSSSTSFNKFATTEKRSDKQDKLHRRLLIHLFGALKRHSLKFFSRLYERKLNLDSPFFFACIPYPRSMEPPSC